MRTLNYLNRYTLLIGILLAAVVLSPGPGASRAGVALHDFAHAPIFSCVTFLLLVVLERRQGERSVSTQYPTAFGLAVLLGIATEILQKLTGGDSSWLDLRSDAIGAFAACGIFAAFDRRISRVAVRVGAALVGIAALTVHSLPFGRVGLAYLHRNQEFPTLFDARDGRSDRFLVATDAQIRYTTLPLEVAKRSGEPTLSVHLSSGEWPGIALEEPYPDWSGHQRLMLDLANPEDTPVDLVLRILDRAHDWRFEDRFNRTLTIAPRTRTIYSITIADIERAPAGRRLDTRAIADVRLFTREARAGRDLFLTRVWLE